MKSINNICYFKLAKLVAMKSNNRCKIGAVLVSGHNILSFGFPKKNCSHYLTRKFYPKKIHSIHAELNAILGIDKEKLKNCSIYVYRGEANNIDNQLLSKPCEYCQNVLRYFKIKKVFYSVPYTEDEKGYKILKI